MGKTATLVSSKTKIEIAAELALAQVKKMNEQQLLKTFVDAGILTKKGNVKKAYRQVFVKSPK